MARKPTAQPEKTQGAGSRPVYWAPIFLLLLIVVLGSTIIWNWVIDVSVAQACLSDQSHSWCARLFAAGNVDAVNIKGIDVDSFSRLTVDVKTSFYLLSLGVVIAVLLFLSTYALFDSQRVVGDKLQIAWKGKAISASASGAVAMAAIVIAGFAAIAYYRLAPNIEDGLKDQLIAQQTKEIGRLTTNLETARRAHANEIADYNKKIDRMIDSHEQERSYLSQTFIETLARRWQVPTVVTIECKQGNETTRLADNDLKAFDQTKNQLIKTGLFDVPIELPAFESTSVVVYGVSDVDQPSNTRDIKPLLEQRMRSEVYESHIPQRLSVSLTLYYENISSRCAPQPLAVSESTNRL